MAVDPAETGHQFFPDIDALAGTLALVWQDNRTDDDYSVQLPLGNTFDERGPARVVGHRRGQHLCGLFDRRRDVHARSPGRCRRESHQPSYEMFGSRDVPFQGDYNWISLAEREDGSLFGYMSWTDNRDVVEGDDLRETTAEGGYDDNFDVLQCRTDLGAPSEDDVTRGRAARPSRRAVQRRQLRQRRRPGPEHLRDVDHVPLASNQLPPRWARPSGRAARQRRQLRTHLRVSKLPTDRRSARVRRSCRAARSRIRPPESTHYLPPTYALRNRRKVARPPIVACATIML